MAGSAAFGKHVNVDQSIPGRLKSPPRVMVPSNVQVTFLIMSPNLSHFSIFSSFVNFFSSGGL